MNGLEALEIILKNKPRVCASCGYASCENCEKALAEAQIEKELKDGAKYKKAIEILKGKGTYMVEIISAVCYYKTYDELLGDACPWCSNRDLKREEFDLLKEVLQ